MYIYIKKKNKKNNNIVYTCVKTVRRDTPDTFRKQSCRAVSNSAVASVLRPVHTPQKLRNLFLLPGLQEKNDVIFSSKHRLTELLCDWSEMDVNMVNVETQEAGS